MHGDVKLGALASVCGGGDPMHGDVTFCRLARGGHYQCIGM